MSSCEGLYSITPSYVYTCLINSPFRKVGRCRSCSSYRLAGPRVQARTADSKLIRVGSLSFSASVTASISIETPMNSRNRSCSCPLVMFLSS